MKEAAVRVGPRNQGPRLANQHQDRAHATDDTAAEQTCTPNGLREPGAVLVDGRALVIDDEPGIRRFARLLLDEAGFDVVLAGDGEAGLAQIRSYEPVDFVLLDLTMPGRSGIEVLAELRRLDRRLPVVLMSGYHEGDLDVVLAADPFTRFLEKPFTEHSLAAAIREARTAAQTTDR
jgi:CheY-like chemotaxis protein